MVHWRWGWHDKLSRVTPEDKTTTRFNAIDAIAARKHVSALPRSSAIERLLLMIGHRKGTLPDPVSSRVLPPVHVPRELPTEAGSMSHGL